MGSQLGGSKWSEAGKKSSLRLQMTSFGLQVFSKQVVVVRTSEEQAAQRGPETEAQEAEGLCDLIPKQQKLQTRATTVSPQSSLGHFTCSYWNY